MVMLALGPFDLTRPIGHGGMAEVWQAVHRASGQVVAVKLVTGPQARRPRYASLFRTEVRAMASLRHPGIVLVLDHGEVPEETAAAAEGRLAAGTPYLVMELASGGSLKELAGPGASPLSWPALRGLLLALLDALAHAHARGVVHRDLKPGNVLICRATDARPGPKLADFGLAHLDDRTRDGGMGASGTPAYMAPEQLADDWRAFGPWTDLYSLGCLAFQLSAGVAPFQAEELPGLLFAHLAHQVVEYEPRRPVPAGFRNWLETMFAREPPARFECAADAARALVELGDAPSGKPEGESPSEGGGSDSEPRRTDVEHDLLTVVNADLEAARWKAEAVAAEEGERLRPTRRVARGPAPVPATWRPPAEDRPAAHLLGAGLGLYGLREIPLVDREAERDTLWEALRRAAGEGRPAAAVLQGPAGCGKSRLAEWLCQRAGELGAAVSLRAVHGETPGPADGLQGMVVRHLRCQGLKGPDVEARVGDLLALDGVDDPDEVAAVSQLVDPLREGEGQDEGSSRIRFAMPRERHVVVERLLRRAAARRAVVVWLDDVQWGWEPLGLVEHLLESEGRLPVLLVLTAQDEALAEREDQRAQLEELLGRPEVARLHVGPLEDAPRGELVRGLLGLEPRLADWVDGRTAGNPLFAVQLVGDWVQRGLLVVGDQGFELRPGVQLDLPADLHEVWTDRVERLLSERPTADGAALELAAVLGQEVDGAEWRSACTEAGLPTPEGLVEVLLSQRLVRVREEAGPEAGWYFVHGMLRESLVLRAREHGREIAHNHTAGRMLVGRRGAGAAERRAWHLLASGEAEQALGPLLDAARERRREGTYALAADLLARRCATLEGLGLLEGDERWGEQWVEQAALARQRGELDVATESAGRAAVASGTPWAARRPGWRRVRAQALLERGVLARLQGEPDVSRALLDDAEAAARDVGDPRLWARSLCEQAHAVLRQGALEEATERFSASSAEYERQGDDKGVATARRGLAGVARQAGDHDAAAAHLVEARDRFQRGGVLWGAALCANDLAEIHRHRGEMEQAEALYRDSIQRYRVIGSRNVLFPELNLGLVLAARGDHAAARATLEAALALAIAQGRRPVQGAVHAFLLPTLAATGDWPAYRTHLTSAQARLVETGMVDVDIARALDDAAALAHESPSLEAGAVEHSALELALAQWEALDREEEAAGARERLGSLAGG